VNHLEFFEGGLFKVGSNKLSVAGIAFNQQRAVFISLTGSFKSGDANKLL